MSLMMQTFVCLSITFNHALRDTYAGGIIITVTKRNLSSFSSSNLTHHYIKVHLFLFRSYFSDIHFQSKPKILFTIFFSIQLKKTQTDKSREISRYVCLAIITNPLMIPLSFPCLLVTL